MNVPKRRTSKSRRNKRRSHHALARPGQSKCTRCGEMKEPHRICSHCGGYKDRSVVPIREV